MNIYRRYDCINFQHKQFPRRRTKCLTHILPWEQKKAIQEYLQCLEDEVIYWAESGIYQINSSQLNYIYSNILKLSIPLSNFEDYNIFFLGYSTKILECQIKVDNKIIYLGIIARLKQTSEKFLMLILTKKDIKEIKFLWPEYTNNKKLPLILQKELRRRNVDLIFVPGLYEYFIEEIDIYDYINVSKIKQ